MSKTKIKVRQADSFADRVMDRLDRIKERAFQLFEHRNDDSVDRALDDWLTAERELARQPLVEVSETEDGYQLEASLPGMDPDDVVVEASKEEVLITAERKIHHGKHDDHGEGHIRMFRVVHFPTAIDPEHVKADYREGLLHVRAPRAKSEDAKSLALSA